MIMLTHPLQDQIKNPSLTFISFVKEENKPINRYPYLAKTHKKLSALVKAQYIVYLTSLFVAMSADFDGLWYDCESSETRTSDEQVLRIIFRQQQINNF